MIVARIQKYILITIAVLSGLLLLLSFIEVPVIDMVASSFGFAAMSFVFAAFFLTEKLLGLALVLVMIAVFLMSHWTLAWPKTHILVNSLGMFFLFVFANVLDLLWLLGLFYLILAVRELRKLKHAFPGLKAPKLSKPGEGGSLEEESKAVG